MKRAAILSFVTASLATAALVRVVETQTAIPQTPSRQIVRVLFIGNSYTYFNNLPDIVAGMAAADPDGPIIVPSLATRGGATLGWHLENGTALKSLASGKWDFVVLQERSLLGGSVKDGKTIVGDPSAFHASTRDWVRRIRAVGATPILYMTWARREPSDPATRVQKELADAYLTIGRELGVKVAPVGLAWAETKRRLYTLDLHMWDASHPTPAGSYLAAAVLYATLTGRSPVGSPSVIQGRPTVPATQGDEHVVDPSLRVPLVDLPAATAAELQEIAWQVFSQHATN
jgi:hypothetical protein